MKNRSLAVLVAGACISLASPVSNAVNIMPFGDSITAFGSAPESSYRYWLYTDLINAGFTDFDFIGNQNGVQPAGGPANFWPDQNYEGGGGDDGITTADGVGLAQSDANSGVDVVLLELGANDPDNNIPASQSEADLEMIIQAFAAQNPSVIVLISTPPKFQPSSNLPKREQNQANAGISKVDGVIGKVVSTEKKAGVNVIKVSLGGYNPRTDTSDGTHPNVKGEQYIAKQFFNALRKAKVF